jgi:hypothetical protein
LITAGDEQIARRPERKALLRGPALLQKDIHDTLRRMGIPAFRTSSRFTIAGRYLARFSTYLFEIPTEYMVGISGTATGHSVFSRNARHFAAKLVDESYRLYHQLWLV